MDVFKSSKEFTALPTEIGSEIRVCSYLWNLRSHWLLGCSCPSPERYQGLQLAVTITILRSISPAVIKFVIDYSSVLYMAIVLVTVLMLTAKAWVKIASTWGRTAQSNSCSAEVLKTKVTVFSDGFACQCTKTTAFYSPETSSTCLQLLSVFESWILCRRE